MASLGNIGRQLGQLAPSCHLLPDWEVAKTFWAFYPAVGDQSALATSAMASNNVDIVLHRGDQLWQPRLFFTRLY